MIKRTVVSAVMALAVAACSGGGDANTDELNPNDVAAVPSEPELPDLSELFSTASASACGWLSKVGAKALHEDSYTLSGDVPEAGPALTLPSVPMPVEPRIIAPSEQFDPYQVRLDVSGRWLGLTVTGMSYSFVPRSDWQFSYLHFAEPVEEVAAALGNAGFPVNTDGSTRRTTLEEGGAMYEYWGLVSNISREGDETTFQCEEAGWD